jgi:hypothetical protein
MRKGDRLLSLAASLVAASNGLAAEAGPRKQIDIYWTDTGVYMGARPEPLKRPGDFMFKPFQGAVEPVVPEIPSAGQILIPMPDNEHLPKTDAGWKEFVTTLKQGMLDRIQDGLKQGVTDFEIRTVQDITIKGGYWAPWQQERCVRFGEAFQTALAEVKSQLSHDSQVTSVGIVGSNGGHMVTESTARMGQTPLDRLILVDARAYVDKTLQAAAILNGNLTIINTGGDAPALADMVANAQGARMVAQADPRIQALYVDPKGWNLPASAHLATMANQPDKKLEVKVLAGNGYGPSQQMSLKEFKDRVFTAQSSSSAELGGVSLDQKPSEGSFQKDTSGALKKARDSIRARRPSGNSPRQ